MKKTLPLIFFICLLFHISHSEVSPIESPHCFSGDSIIPWDKPYAMEYIIEMKKYVKIQEKELQFNLTRRQAIHELKVPKQAYKDLNKNIKEVNKQLRKCKTVVYVPSTPTPKHILIDPYTGTAKLDSILPVPILPDK